MKSSTGAALMRRGLSEIPPMHFSKFKIRSRKRNPNKEQKMFLLLSSDDRSLQVRVKNIDSAEVRDEKGNLLGTQFIANGETPLFLDTTLQKRAANLAEAKKAVEQANVVLADFQKKADDEAIQQATAAGVHVGDVVVLKSGGPEMNVESIDRDGVHTRWPKEDGSATDSVFPVETLNVVPPPPVAKE